MIEERYGLASQRILQIAEEAAVGECFQDYFRVTAKFAQMIIELKVILDDGAYGRMEIQELEEWNQRLYFDILPQQYDQSYANPDYAADRLGMEYGQLLSFLYTELRGAIAYAFGRKTEYLDILFELYIEIYNVFEEYDQPSLKELREIIYWYASDYSDVFAADRIWAQLDPQASLFSVGIIMNSDLEDLRYLYQFGEYISENERKTALHLNGLDEQVIEQMAESYTEGFRKGFLSTGRDISKKGVVNIRYVIGFERVIRKAIRNFAAMGLHPVVFRSPVTALTKFQHFKIGYRGAIANKQYEYDHKDDQALFFDKKYIERKLTVVRTAYEHQKELASQFAGPAIVEMFGEIPFSPVQKDTAIKLSKRQKELSLSYDSRSSQLVQKYIPGEERSFTLVAYPVPEIGGEYPEIFDEIIKINTLDSQLYTRVQQTLIDALDSGRHVRITGKGKNKTDITVQLCKLNNPEKETIFENCVADVNIPVGEVFTSPVLAGTSGVLHVSRAYLRGMEFKELMLTFANGMVADYSCKNFERELENKRYIEDNILNNHPTLALGEFAIGTNTTAFAAAKKYGIEDKLPVLIAEKMGPHFAVGDTCYSWSEDMKVFNPDGKEIVARDNEVSALRKEDVSKAYYHCHTDITVPYNELGDIVVVTDNEGEIKLVENGRFVLPGTEILNEPLKNMDK